MEKETFSVKIEPEEDMEYNLHHEELEIKSEIDLPIKSEIYFKEEVNDYHETQYFPEPATFDPIKEELPKHRENLKLLGQDGTSQTKYKGLMSHFLQTNRKELNVKNTNALRVLRGEVNVLNMEVQVQNVKKKDVLNGLRRGVNVLNMEGSRLKKHVKKKGVLNGLKVVVTVLTMEGSSISTHVNKKVALNGL